MHDIISMCKYYSLFVSPDAWWTERQAQSRSLLIRLLRTAVCTEHEQVPSLYKQGTASYFDISILYIACDTVREMHVLAEVCVQSFTASAISSQLWIRVLAYMRNLRWIFNSPIKQARALRFKGSTNSWVESSSAHTHTHGPGYKRQASDSRPLWILNDTTKH